MSDIRKLLTFAAVAGNVLFILWILFNGWDEGWKATPFQLLSYIGLTILLILNSYLVLSKDKSD